MQIHRLFEMVYLLLHRKRMTARELAERFEVSERTIYRDVDALSAAGIPIYTSKGKGGGIGLLDDFVLNKSLLSQEEQQEILWALEGLQAVSGTEEGRLLGRLGALFQQPQTSWIDVDFSHWGSSPQEKENFALIRGAILERRQMAFDYYSAAGQHSRRTVEPVKLCLKDRVWYLKAYCLHRDAYRLFRLSRISAPRLTGVLFSPRPEPPPPLEAFPDEKRPPQMVRLTARIEGRYAYRVLDDFGPERAQQMEDGSFLVRVCLPMDEWVPGYFLSYGGGAEVLEPAWLRQEIAGRLGQGLRLYEGENTAEPW